MRHCLVIVKDYLASPSLLRASGGCYFLLVFLFLLSGCIDDDTSDCSPVISLRIRAEVSVSGDVGGENTFNDTGVYVFDEQGVLTEYGRMQSAEDASGQTVEFSVPEGKYTIVTWCGADFDNDYEVVAITPSGEFSGSFVKGETRLADMRLHAKAGEVSSACTGNLFWAIVQEVTVNSGVNLVKLDSKLQKNSNIVEVVLKGVAETDATRAPVMDASPSASHFDVSLSTVAGVYKFDNSADLELSTPCSYLPYETTVVGTDLHLRLRTLRLFIDIPVMLTVTDTRTGNAVYTADLIELILKNPAYRTQADLDKEDTYKIVVGGAITAPDAGISITVNGWEIIILEPLT